MLLIHPFTGNLIFTRILREEVRAGIPFAHRFARHHCMVGGGGFHGYAVDKKLMGAFHPLGRSRLFGVHLGCPPQQGAGPNVGLGDSAAAGVPLAGIYPVMAITAKQNGAK
jgi:hypothetical protein